MKQALTIAGSDSGAGAGIQADLKTFHANGVYGLTVITSVTAQNTRAVTAAYDLSAEAVEKQIDAVFDDFDVAAVKTGMLSSAEIVAVVGERLSRRRGVPIVVDPVMLSKSGHALLRDDAVTRLKTVLLPLASLVTPNAPEAARLAEFDVRTLDDARRAARRIRDLGCGAVLVKGGHLDGEEDAVDVLFDGHRERLFRERRVPARSTHGTGCTLSAAIAAHLARGKTLEEAVAQAKQYVTGAIRHGLSIGQGQGPMDHFYREGRP